MSRLANTSFHSILQYHTTAKDRSSFVLRLIRTRNYDFDKVGAPRKPRHCLGNVTQSSCRRLREKQSQRMVPSLLEPRHAPDDKLTEVRRKYSRKRQTLLASPSASITIVERRWKTLEDASPMTLRPTSLSCSNQKQILLISFFFFFRLVRARPCPVRAHRPRSATLQRVHRRKRTSGP